jgi:Zn-finger protein
MGPILSCRTCGYTQKTSGNKWWSCKACGLRQTAPVKSNAWTNLLIWIVVGALACVLARETRTAYQKDMQFRERYIQMEQGR